MPCRAAEASGPALRGSELKLGQLHINISLQGDQIGQGLGFVDFASVVPMSDLFFAWAEKAEPVGTIEELQQ